MRRTFLHMATMTAGALLVAAGALQAQDWSWSGSVDRGDAVEVRGVNGEIHAERTSGSEVEVVAQMSARRSDVGTVRIEVIEDASGVLICAVYPDRDGKEPNRCGRDDDYHMNTSENDVQVDFLVRVPDGVNYIGVTVNGDASALDLTGEVNVVTVNGSIAMSTSGWGSATTVNGSIDAEIGATSWDRPLNFTTVNGAITVGLPAGVQADVEAQTLNGGIETDFEMVIRGQTKLGMRQLDAEIGGGGGELELTTVNGAIRLVRMN